MRLFSEKVSPTLTDSPLNIIKVQDFSEIFFGVYEIEINKNKYPVEKISEHNGDPVVSIPVEMGGKIANYPFVLTKGKFEVVFNEESDYVDIFESKMEDSIEEEPITITGNGEIFVPEVVEEQKNDILLQIQEAKKNALIAAKKELELKKSRQIKQIREESETKKKALESYLESARENLVDEFTIISQRIKKEVFDNNDEKYSEIRETIDNKIEEIRDSLDESLKKDFSKSSQLIDKSIKQLVKDLWEKNINPKVDKELRDIAVEIHEKVSEIDNNLNSKLDKKADRSLLEGVDKEISAIQDANIELNNSLNKGVQKALSRVGNVDKKVIQISEDFERKLDEKEREVVSYFNDKLALVKEETLDITDEARKYFQNLIQESRDGLLSEIRKIKVEKPVEYILETKKSGKVVKDWDSIEKEWNSKIHDKIENVKTDLRKYVTVYASGGGTNATQYQDGGTMNGDLTVVGNIFTDNLAISGDLTSVDSITFDTTAAEESAIGKLKWNDEDGTLDLGLKGGNVTLQIGQETVIRAVNKTDTNLLESNYQVARIRAESEGGSQGQRLAIVLAQADSDDNSVDTLGLVTENIGNNQEGFVTTFGLVRNINTTGSLQGETWSDGDVVYLSPTIAGRLTNIKPQAPQHTVIVGFVVYSHQNSGKIFVKVDNGYELDELHNVKINDVSNSDILTYDSVLDVWKNSNTINVATLSATTLSADRIYTTQLDALSANITVIDIKQYELSGFNVLGDSTVHGSISASGNITADNMILSGNQVATVVDPVRTTLTGDGVLSAFAINGAGSLSNPSALIVAIDGALQEPTVDYGVSGGVITFTSPLASGAKAVVISPTNTLQVSEMIPADGSVSSAKLANDLEISGIVEFNSAIRPTAPNLSGSPTDSSFITLGDAKAKSPYFYNPVITPSASVGYMPLGFNRFDTNANYGWGTNNVPAPMLPYCLNAPFSKISIRHVAGTHPTATLEIAIYLPDSTGKPHTLVEQGTISLSAASGIKTLTLSQSYNISGLFYVAMRPSIGTIDWAATGGTGTLALLGTAIAHCYISSALFGSVNPTNFSQFQGSQLIAYSSYTHPFVSTLPAYGGELLIQQTSNGSQQLPVLHA